MAIDHGGGGGGGGGEGRGRLVVVLERRERDHSSSCSSSIGRNSDSFSHGFVGSDEDDEAEVQSELKGPLDTMDALEDCLPIKRGISKFYCGKSRSFTRLVNASSSSSSKDLAKPGNPYTRKRKNLLAFSKNWSGEHNGPLPNTGDHLHKRLMTTNRCMPALARSLSSSDSNSNSSLEHEQKHSPLLPPRHPCGKVSIQFPVIGPQKDGMSMRSFSLSDLQGAR